ncbi:MAG: hypothetical protein RIC35_17535 [Marinoscillum sp.]
MKTLLTTLTCLFLTAFSFAKEHRDLTANFQQGDPQIASINALTFGPQGILFIGDSKNAKVFAIATEDITETSLETLELKNVDEVIASSLGTTVDEISIQDMVVNPISKNAYFAIQTGDGTPVLLKLANGTFENIPLDNTLFSESAINNVLEEDATDRRGRPLRVWTVSDLSYYNGQVMVSGLSNKEFSSTFRSIPFPFEGKQKESTLEIYHAAHGRYETYAPIKAFTAATVSGKPHLIASYTCTPLVVFPLENLKPGEHVKGRTIAELGNWNTPLDMIVMEKDGEQYLLMANSARAVMKIKFEDIESFQGGLTTEVEERSGTAGVEFIALPFVNVLQLDKLNGENFVMLQRDASGKLNLTTQTNTWL